MSTIAAVLHANPEIYFNIIIHFMNWQYVRGCGTISGKNSFKYFTSICHVIEMLLFSPLSFICGSQLRLYQIDKVISER